MRAQGALADSFAFPAQPQYPIVNGLNVQRLSAFKRAGPTRRGAWGIPSHGPRGQSAGTVGCCRGTKQTEPGSAGVQNWAQGAGTRGAPLRLSGGFLRAA